ncbi:hypothetical protein PsYK624_057690 [Phanerochaete sordida]|uniref:Uncharacterized protein n=1 Tax=Phanerochaete sordida TaxID=48140 RepID=A0A9P3G7D4_9APHY|nr:hypothetical protein PsYK624_057690 [Phanerochaete sordida]
MSSPLERRKSLPLPENLPAHPPAQKVAGRRMSMSSRPKPHAAHIEQKPAADTAQNDTGPDDYPRPAAPGEQPAHEHHQHEEEQPKRERSHGMSDHERRLKEAQHKRAEASKLPRGMSTGSKTGGVKISQPVSRALGV